MKREFLKELGLEKEVIDKIMEENGKDINEQNTLKQNIESLKTENQKLSEEVKSYSGASENNQNEIASLNSQIEELTGKVKNYELSNLKTQVAINNGIPYNLASRLVGTTEEELQTDAKKLSSFISRNEPVAPLKDPESKISSEDGAYQNLLNSLNLGGE